jgi:hypothetical protein
MAIPKSKFRIWKADRDSDVGFMVTPESAFMIGSKNSFFATSKEGNVISGPLSFIATGEQIRQAGLFVKMNDFVKMIPSTMVTPIPDQIPFPPVAMFTSIAKSLPFALAFLA